MTARWVVDEVAPARDLTVSWEPISLLFKNKPTPGTDYHRASWRTHRVLRVMESVRTEYGNPGVFQAYWAFATRIHHDRQLFDLDVEEVLSGCGLRTAHADAYGDESWDAKIRKRMDTGLDLVGQDVGTPIIAMDDQSGGRVGIFGPVITSVPPGEEALRLWDIVVQATLTPSFWELKRTRTMPPEFGERPSGVPLP